MFWCPFATMTASRLKNSLRRLRGLPSGSLAQMAGDNGFEIILACGADRLSIRIEFTHSRVVVVEFAPIQPGTHPRTLRHVASN